MAKKKTTTATKAAKATKQTKTTPEAKVTGQKQAQKTQTQTQQAQETQQTQGAKQQAQGTQKEKLPEVKLIRYRYGQHDTIGLLILPDGTVLYTLEDPWRENQRNMSCIPEGEYIVVNDETGQKRIARVLDVPNRDAIEFHAGNSHKDTQGCILLGLGIQYNKNLTESWLIASRDATYIFKDFIRRAQKAKLIITSVNNPYGFGKYEL